MGATPQPRPAPATAAPGQEALLARLRAEARERQRDLEIARALGRAPGGGPAPAETAPAPSGGASTAEPLQPPPAAGGFDLSCAVRVKWGDQGAGEGGAAPPLSEALLTEAFGGFGEVLAVISRRERSAVVVFATRGAADAACASPPAARFRVTPVVDLGRAEPPQPPVAGTKRPREEEGVGAPAPAPAPAPAAPTARSFASREADTLQRMMEAAARKKAAAAAAASSSAAGGGGAP